MSNENSVLLVVFGLCFLIIIIAIVIYFLINRNNDDETQSDTVHNQNNQIPKSTINGAPPTPQLPPNTKQCFECKSIIAKDALTCPICGKDPSKASAIGKRLTTLGINLTLLPISLTILAISICCLIALFSN